MTTTKPDTPRKAGRPMSDRMQEALKRVANGERVLHVAHAMGFKNSQQLYLAVARERKRQSPPS